MVGKVGNGARDGCRERFSIVRVLLASLTERPGHFNMLGVVGWRTVFESVFKLPDFCLGRYCSILHSSENQCSQSATCRRVGQWKIIRNPSLMRQRWEISTPRPNTQAVVQIEIGPQSPLFGDCDLVGPGKGKGSRKALPHYARHHEDW